jgi:hypothetical protein
MADTGTKAPASQGKSFLRAFLQKSASFRLPFSD